MEGFSGEGKPHWAGESLWRGIGNRGKKELQKREASLSRHMTEEKVENISWIQAHRMEKEELEILEEKLQIFQRNSLSVKSRMDAAKARLKGKGYLRNR